MARIFGFVSDLAIDSDGNLQVGQRSDPPILVFDPHGALLRTWGRDEIAGRSRPLRDHQWSGSHCRPRRS